MSKRSHPAVIGIVRELDGKIPKLASHSVYSPGETSEKQPSIILRTVPIIIGIPMDEVMFSRFFAHYLELDVMPWDATLCLQNTYLAEARNKIHNGFLKKKDYDHLLMLDSDVLPPSNLIEVLLKHDKPMVGGWYSKKELFPVKDLEGNVTHTQRPVVFDYKDGKFYHRLNPGKGLEKVGGAGAGCWLMRRDVAEAIGENPYGNVITGEDLKLCKEIMDKGFEMYVDWDLKCGHSGVFTV